jgi:hypothetical protein
VYKEKQVMTPRERFLAALDGKPVDRLPFWPKVGAAFRQAQGEPWRSMSEMEVFAALEADPQVMIPYCIAERRATTSRRTEPNGNARRTVFTTPAGETTMIEHYDPGSLTTHPVQYPVRDRETMRIMTAYYEDASWEIDRELLRKSRDFVSNLGERGLANDNIGESPLMYFVEWLAGVANGHLLLADYPDETGELFAAIHAENCLRTELLGEASPAEIIYMVENTSTTLISPEQFRTHCLRHLTEHARILKKRGRRFGLHMCGHVKALLPDIAGISAAAIEALTSPPVGDTCLVEAREACPDLCLNGAGLVRANGTLDASAAGAKIDAATAANAGIRLIGAGQLLFNAGTFDTGIARASRTSTPPMRSSSRTFWRRCATCACRRAASLTSAATWSRRGLRFGWETGRRGGRACAMTRAAVRRSWRCWRRKAPR